MSNNRRPTLPTGEIRRDPPRRGDDSPELIVASGAIADLRSAVIGGNSVYYLRLEGDERWFVVPAATYPLVILLDPGNQVELRATGAAAMPDVTSIEVLS